MHANKPFKISYCTTCKGRLHHLKQTLPANMAAEKDNPNVEFVVLDYGSEDGLADWIKQNFQEEMQSGRLRYARYEAPHFKMAHAKNMAHRLATGDVLCNVDADNFIAPNFSHWLRDVFEHNPKSFVTCHMVKPIDFVKRYFYVRLGGWRHLPNGGMGGRIAIMRHEFEQLAGYDESVGAWCDDDKKFCHLAQSVGLNAVRLPKEYHGSTIDHDNDLRLANLAPQDRHYSLQEMRLSHDERRLKNFKSSLEKSSGPTNPDGKCGCGAVCINFSEQPTEIGPLIADAHKLPQANLSAEMQDKARGNRSDWGERFGRSTQIGGVYKGR
jgi:glycosyltransferase involved in cell wall biosynthesis